MNKPWKIIKSTILFAILFIAIIPLYISSVTESKLEDTLSKQTTITPTKELVDARSVDISKNVRFELVKIKDTRFGRQEAIFRFRNTGGFAVYGIVVNVMFFNDKNELIHETNRSFSDNHIYLPNRDYHLAFGYDNERNIDGKKATLDLATHASVKMVTPDDFYGIIRRENNL